jgi:hypothetical protein
MTMGSLIVNHQGTGMKQVAYFVLVAAVALAAPIPAAPIPAAMAGPGEGEFLLEDDGYQPLLPDVGGGDDDGGYRPDWANPNTSPSEIGVNDDPTPFHPSDPVGIPPNQD